jgi:ectoine hydroxylase-related dioxygenase (phytanoyl-CoA dioxygenase family)
MNASTTAPIGEWVEQFHRDGYLFLHKVLSPEYVAELKADLESALEERTDQQDKYLELRNRMFEVSAANLRLFEQEPIVSFAEALIDGPCHVVHNNSFRTPPGAGVAMWHQDDAPHFRILHGEAPANIRLSVLLFTANYYLSDVDDVSHGPTQVIPGSHLFGKAAPTDLSGTPYEEKIVSCLGKAGSVVLFNNQVWHRGAPNTSTRTRHITQVSYARRLVGHKYFPFMNYQMPEHVYADANPRLKRLLGFLPKGAYG